MPKKPGPFKTRAFSHPVHLGSLRALICARAGVQRHSQFKLPDYVKVDFTTVLHSETYDFSTTPPSHPPFEGFHRIHVIPANRSGVPRIFILCLCGKLIPAGRAAQHVHLKKFGTIQLAPSPAQ